MPTHDPFEERVKEQFGDKSTSVYLLDLSSYSVSRQCL